jgi:acyl-homoserine-lactone acylase
MRRFLLTLVLTAAAAWGAPNAEILWDRYGVPHVFASDRESMFYAEGWAQAQAQGNLLLLLYGESRGRAAEYWGPTHVALDRWVQLNGVPERAIAWHQAQDPEFRKYIDAFARGINDYCNAHTDSIAPQYRVVLPVSGIDVVGHSLRAVHYMYMGSKERAQRESAAYLKGQKTAGLVQDDPDKTPGSNTWAVGPTHSASGNAMLIINPHLAWGETFYRYMEVHLVGPGYDLYGAPQIGFPTPVVGFNPDTGWGRTVNTIDTVDFFALKVRDGKYEFDGKLRAFETETKTLKVKQADGSMKEEKLEIRRSIHGPVVFDEQGATIAMRVAGLDRPKMLEQWFRMGEARNLEQFKDALRLMAVPMWNANYAGSDGHIMLVFDGLVPRRKLGDAKYWSGVVPGDTSETLWTEYHSFDDLPKSIDPPSGYNLNTNEPPWFITTPHLDPAKYPAYMAPKEIGGTLFRMKRSNRMMTQDDKISYEQLLADKFSTRSEMADSLLPELLKAAEESSDNNVKEAAAVLARWDRMTEADSRGAVLFKLFAGLYFQGGDFAAGLRVKPDPDHPLESAYGIADPTRALRALSQAALNCRKKYGSLDVPWGEVNRFATGNADVPANGGSNDMGVFRTISFAERKDGVSAYAVAGESFHCAIEFAKRQRAGCTLSYGNSSQPGSPHQEDQLPLMVAKKFHPVWRDRTEIEANLEKREAF